MEPEPDRPDTDGGDEVARQRRKRRTAVLSRAVPGWPTMTIGELAEEARTASGTAGEGGDVERFLVEAGHRRATIDVVLWCLGLVGPDAAGDAPAAAAVGAIPETSSGQQRLRTLAQLEAMLLKE